MKVYQTLLPLLAAMAMIAGCESRSSAEMMVGQAQDAVEKVRPEASVKTADQFKPLETTLSQMKQNFAQGEYKAVKSDATHFNAQYKTLMEAMTAKQVEADAIIQEWATLNNDVPKSVEAVQARVDSLKPNALPKDVTKDELETAKKDLETAKATWDEATKAANAGNPAEARDKARIVQAKMEELKNSLGMTAQVASNTPTSAG